MAGRDLTFGISFRRRGMKLAARGVRSVSDAIRTTGTVSRRAVGGVSRLGREAGSAMGRIAAYGEAHRRAVSPIRQASRATDAARRSTERYGHALGRMRRVGGLAMRGLRGGLIGSSLLGGAASWSGMIQQSTTLDARLTRLMTNARAGRLWIDSFFDTATASAQRYGVALDGITAGVERVISDTGDRAFAAASIDPIARAMQAWGAGGADIGMLAAKLRDLGVDPGRGLSILGAIGLRGSVPLPAMAREAGRVFGGVSKLGGWGGEEGMTQIAALLQSAAIMQGGAEGVAEASTALLAFVRFFLKPENRQRLQRAGISAYEDGRLRMPMDVISDIRDFAAGDNRRLGKIFTEAESMMAIIGMLDEQGWKQAQEFMVRHPAAAADETAALAANTRTAAAEMERFKTTVVDVTRDLVVVVGPTMRLLRQSVEIAGALRQWGEDVSATILGWAVRLEQDLKDGLSGLPARLRAAVGLESPEDRDRRLAGHDPAVSLAQIARLRMQQHTTSGVMAATLGPDAADRLAGRLPAFAADTTGAIDMLAPPPPAAIRATATPPAPPARPATSAAGVDIPPEVLAAIPPGGHVVIHRGGDIGEINFTINAPTAEAEDIADAVRGSAEELLAVVDRERGAATAQHD